MWHELPTFTVPYLQNWTSCVHFESYSKCHIWLCAIVLDLDIWKYFCWMVIVGIWTRLVHEWFGPKLSKHLSLPCANFFAGRHDCDTSKHIHLPIHVYISHPNYLRDVTTLCIWKETTSVKHKYILGDLYMPTKEALHVRYSFETCHVLIDVLMYILGNTYT